MKKALSVALALSMVIGATMTSFAANGEITHVNGKPKYDAFRAAQPGPKGLITTQPEKFVVEWGGKYYSIKEIIDYIKANPGKIMKDAIESGTLTEQSKPGETDVLVASISAVNKTTVNVEFTKKPEKPLGKEDFLKLGVEGIEILSVNQGVQETVYTLTVKELKGKGTIKIGGKSVDYDFTAAANTGIQGVTLDNYRQITVKFAQPVLKSSAVNGDNYYFEIVQGEAGDKLGAAELGTTYQLSKITNGAGKAPVIVSYLNGKKTEATDTTADEVRIQFDKEARLGNYVTGGVDHTVIIELKALAGAPSKDKLLDKNSVVYLSTRNIANPEGKLVYDTSVNEIKINDSVNPEIVAVLDKDGNELDYAKKPFDLLFDQNQKLTIVYNEPIAVENEPATTKLQPYELKKVTLNGESVLVEEADKITQVEGLDYNQMTKVVVDLKKLAAKSTNNKQFIKLGETSTLQVNGIRDIAGNLGPNLSLNFKFVRKQEQPGVDPKIVDVVQVADNIFAVIANKENVTGVLNIKKSNQDGSKDIRTLIPYTSTKINAAMIELDSKWEPFKGNFYSLVQVDATGLKHADKMSYGGKNEVNFDLVVENAAYFPGQNETIANAKLVDPFSKPNMLITMDTMGPSFVSDKLEVDKINGKLYVPVNEVLPANHYRISGANTIEANTEDGAGTNEAGVAVGTAFEATAELSVEYTDVNGDTQIVSDQVKYVHNFGAGDGHKLKADLTTKAGYLTFDLRAWKALGSNGLEAAFLTGADKLIPGATYKVILPEKVITDTYYVAAGGADLENGKLPQANLNDYETNVYNGAAAATNVTNADAEAVFFHGSRTTKRGVVAGGGTFVFKIEPDASSSQVPQTSMFDDGTDPAVSVVTAPNGGQELKVLFTGSPTVDSLRDLKNYQINGQTLESLGAQASDVKISKAAATDVIGATNATWVVRIPLPKNSIESDGPARVTIENIAHVDGGKMALVDIPAVKDFKDNTSPVVTKAEYTANGKLVLTFNENLKLIDTATIDAAKLNIDVTVNGVGANISTLGISGNQMEITIQNNNLSAETNLSVKFKYNTENIMNLSDNSGNRLDPAYGANANVQMIFVP